jgi:hypothetical protein
MRMKDLTRTVMKIKVKQGADEISLEASHLVSFKARESFSHSSTVGGPG